MEGLADGSSGKIGGSPPKITLAQSTKSVYETEMNYTGMYLRVLRDGKWQPIRVELTTTEERNYWFKDRGNEELLRWIDLFCNTLCQPPDPISVVEL